MMMSGIPQCGQCAFKPGRLRRRRFITIQCKHCTQTAMA